MLSYPISAIRTFPDESIVIPDGKYSVLADAAMPITATLAVLPVPAKAEIMPVLAVTFLTR